MDMMEKVGKGFLRLSWFVTKLAVNIVLSAASGSSSTTKRYTPTQAHGLFHEGKISIAEYAESNED